MRAMTLYQPWASLIVEGVKTIETRPKWSPWSRAIGETIAVHAAKHIARLNEAEAAWAAFTLDQYNATRSTENPSRFPPGDQSCDSLPLGAVVATCTLVDVVPMLGYCGTDMGQPTHLCGTHGETYPLLLHRPDWSPLDGETEFDVSGQRPFGDFAPGRFALILDNVRKCAPFPCRGYQGLWTLPDRVADNLVSLCA